MEIIETTMAKPVNSTNYAGFWLRFVAFIIDGIIINIFGIIIFLPFIFSYGISFIKRAINDSFSKDDLFMVGSFILGLIGISIVVFILKWLYYALMESSKCQGTLGKMILGLVVTDMDGGSVSFGKATGRFFAKIISNMTFYIGYIISGFTPKKQALHDVIASCLVLRKQS